MSCIFGLKFFLLFFFFLITQFQPSTFITIPFMYFYYKWKYIHIQYAFLVSQTTNYFFNVSNRNSQWLFICILPSPLEIPLNFRWITVIIRRALAVEWGEVWHCEPRTHEERQPVQESFGSFWGTYFRFSLSY